jgi:hypothetical protein
LGVVKKHYLNGTGFLRYLRFDFHVTSLRLESFLQEKLYRLVDLHPTSIFLGGHLPTGASHNMSIKPTAYETAL